MRKSIFKTLAATLLLPLLCLGGAGLLSSCSEQDDEGEYDNWRERNEAYIDSIARLARANADGSWAMYKAFDLGDSLDLNGDNNYYIYVRAREEGSGTYRPLYNDSVRVHYSGRLIPTTAYPAGYNFGKSFNGDVLNESVDVPSLMSVKGNVVGFATALMHMRQGERCQVIIPYYLGYGTTSNTSGNIPAYSTLIFDVQLARIYRRGIDTDTSWW